MQTQTLVGHRDIMNWVDQRQGRPALSRLTDPTGTIDSRLAIHFAQTERPSQTPSQNDGVSPCSWTAWLAELDRQNLALKVSDQDGPAVEFVDRNAMN